MIFLFDLRDSDVSQSALKELGRKKRYCETELDFCHVFVLIVKLFFQTLPLRKKMGQIEFMGTVM